MLHQQQTQIQNHRGVDYNPHLNLKERQTSAFHLFDLPSPLITTKSRSDFNYTSSIYLNSLYRKFIEISKLFRNLKVMRS